MAILVHLKSYLKIYKPWDFQKFSYMSLKVAVRPFKWAIDQAFMLNQPTTTLIFPNYLGVCKANASSVFNYIFRYFFVQFLIFARFVYDFFADISKSETPPPPHQQSSAFDTSSPLKSADVIYGRPLMHLQLQWM